MQRHRIEPRPHWQQIVEEQGLVFPVTRFPDGTLRPYWDESAYYTFTLPEVEALEEVVEELHAMCLQAADHIVAKDRFAELGITDPALAATIARSWRRRAEQPSVYGRFDLHYDGTGPAKLLEYNADTPTTLVEAASPQWFWMEERFPGADQWNSLHERLVAAWRRQAALLPAGQPVYFAYSHDDEQGEDQMTVLYLRETAQQAGLATRGIAMEDIGWDPLSGRFVDDQYRFLRSVFKLYPWEWLVNDPFGKHALRTADLGGGSGSTLWIEPFWKMLLSNKALLAVLWELFPGHPNLLPAHLGGPRDLTEWIAKPLLGREGSGIRVSGDLPKTRLHGEIRPEASLYGEEGYCWQQWNPLPEFDGNRVVLGAWVVDGEPAGLSIRESVGLITDEYACFVPHVIL
jgi:Glutathionylspermidine synthase